MKWKFKECRGSQTTARKIIKGSDVTIQSNVCSSEMNVTFNKLCSVCNHDQDEKNEMLHTNLWLNYVSNQQFNHCNQHRHVVYNRPNCMVHRFLGFTGAGAASAEARHLDCLLQFWIHGVEGNFSLLQFFPLINVCCSAKFLLIRFVIQPLQHEAHVQIVTVTRCRN